MLRARHTLQLSPIATRNTGPATIAGLPAANPQGLQAVCRAIGRISIPARKLQCCSQSQRSILYDPMTHSLSKMRSHGLSRESSPYLEWDCEGTGSKLQRVPRALRFGLQLVVDQMLQTLKSCSVCRAPYFKIQCVRPPFS